MEVQRKYGNWIEDDLQRTISAYKNGDHGLNACARMYGVSKATLKRHADEKNSYHNGVRYWKTIFLNLIIANQFKD